MSKKILCPFHQEDTPSCVLYQDHFHCYGCGTYGPLTELEGIKLPPKEELEPAPPEDIQKTITYIETLPTRPIRGLSFPANAFGYYVVWPDKTYYKFRAFAGEPKYIGARGHQKPLFWARREGHATLAVVEGEINALSVAEAHPQIDVVSPGGVGDFSERRTKKDLTLYYRYSTILIMADSDKPGAEAIINMLSVLWANKIKVIGMPMQPDANEMLVKYGRERLRAEIEAKLGSNVEGISH